jgi:hypothetical protein
MGGFYVRNTGRASPDRLRNRSANKRRLPFRLDDHTGMQLAIVRGDYGTRAPQENHERR